jgi:hypothetical protein
MCNDFYDTASSCEECHSFAHRHSPRRGHLASHYWSEPGRYQWELWLIHSRIEWLLVTTGLDIHSLSMSWLNLCLQDEHRCNKAPGRHRPTGRQSLVSYLAAMESVSLRHRTLPTPIHPMLCMAGLSLPPSQPLLPSKDATSSTNELGRHPLTRWSSTKEVQRLRRRQA